MPAKKTPAGSAGKPAKKTPARRAAAKKVIASKTRPAKAKSRALAKNPPMDDLWEDDLTAQYPAFKKNNFLSLIVLGLGALLVVTGIYIQVHKEEPTNSSEMTGNQETISWTDDSVTGATTNTNPTPTNTPSTSTFPMDAQKMVENFYTYFNQNQFDQIPAMYDTNFSNVPGLKTYFNVTRLENWKKNIIGDMQISEVNAVIDHPFVQKNPNAMVVQYKTHYTVEFNAKQYDETWYAYVLRYGSSYKLNGFECQENCATSAFFQLR